ncbi:MAG: (d)CMP kinase [Chloroflexi bacterium]|nr:(d)CMP kinase [Chloroflexota bacterium]
MVIDGPAGAGKSTVGAALAVQLGYRFFDTGLLYRAVTLAALRQGVSPTDAARLATLAGALDLTFETPTVVDGRPVTVRLAGEDVTWALRQPAVNAQVSVVSAHAAVRQALLDQQRAIARCGGIVMVGRDIGTTVLPEADVKIYLDASVAERAARRVRERQARGETTTLASERANVVERDALDSQRAASPLRVAADAVRVDTDGLTIEGVVACLVRLCRAQA